MKRFWSAWFLLAEKFCRTQLTVLVEAPHARAGRGEAATLAGAASAAAGAAGPSGNHDAEIVASRSYLVERNQEQISSTLWSIAVAILAWDAVILLVSKLARREPHSE